MIDFQLTFDQIFERTISIDAPPSKVWAALTSSELMKVWMSEAVVDIVTDWQVGSPIIIVGQVYKKPFENKGLVLLFEEEKELQYTHLSALSGLPDIPENHSKIEFRLTPDNAGTILSLTVSNFPTEAIYRHLAFYWNVTLHVLKKFLE